jgi:hypothetical protein
MAHECQMNFVNSVKMKYPNNFENVRVLEIGSYNVNGTVRVFFDKCEYVGIDVMLGDCVDVVCSGHEYCDDRMYDTIITCEMFEHNPHWIETWNNILKLTKSGGLVVMTCATTGRGEHGTKRTSPTQSLSSELYGDYYMNLTENDFRSITDIEGVFDEFGFSVVNTDLYFYGKKK